ncbi:MAG: M64 family metallo-endopeptidase, partial [Verrucomicrobia bacterium]|nr:M64 family metallo-endopeptidase [Verrucomicrobiota bacterium]
MKTLILLLTLVTATVLRAQTSTLVTAEENGSRSTRLNLVFLSEGYTSSEMGKFATDVQAAVTFLFTKEPWVRYRSYCNIYSIEIASNQSGTDYVTPSTLYPTPQTRDTYFQTGFITPGISQLNILSGTGSSRVYSLLNKHVPEYDIPIVLINDPRYGGSGGPIALTTTDPGSAGILEHELGHSFAKLTDEYDEEYLGYPPTEFPNATAKTDLSQIRWNMWIEPGTPLFTPEYDSRYQDKVGHFEGANYRRSGWYRPHDAALMRFLNRPPGNVTREAILLSYYSRVSPMDDYAPKTLTRTVTSQLPLTFSVTPKVPSTGPSLTVQWLLDNVTISGQTGSTLNLASKDIGNGAHKIKAIVKDPTDWVRRDPTALTSDEITWSLTTAVITTQLPPMTVLQEGSSLQLDATSTGTGPISYRWFKNNVELKPAVTTPTLNVGPVSLVDTGTYTVRVTNPAATVSHSSVLGVIKSSIPQVVVGKGRTATLPITASANVTTAFWSFAGGPTLSNNARYAGATTKSLQIKTVDIGDSGNYSFSTGTFTGGQAQLLVVTGETDYTGQAVNLPTGIIGATYSQPFPAPNNPLLTPNSYTAIKLPKGLAIHSKTGLITGIPTVASVDQANGDEVSFTVGNEFGKKTTLKVRLLIKPLPPGVQGSFAGPVYFNSALGSTTGGLMTITINSTGSYTGSAVIGTETLSFSGTVRTATPTDTTASGTIILKPKHLSSPLSRTFTITDSLDSDPFTAALSDGPTNFQLWRNKWADPGSVNPYAGYHTFYLTASPNANAPKGHGFGSVSIDTTGRTIATGQLADGSSFSTTSFLSPAGSVFVYQTLYATVAKGSFIAFLDLELGSPAYFNTSNSISNWFRPADTRPISATIGRSYRNGFGLGVNPETPLPIGGLYVPPAKTVIPMELPAPTGAPITNALLTFATTLGADPVAVNADVSMNIKAGGATIVNPNSKLVSFSLTPVDGRFKGSYTTKDNDPRPPVAPAASRPQITRRVDYQGIIVRENGTQKG